MATKKEPEFAIIEAALLLPSEYIKQFLETVIAIKNGDDVDVATIEDTTARALIIALSPDLKPCKNRKGIGGAPKGNQNARKKQSKEVICKSFPSPVSTIPDGEVFSTQETVTQSPPPDPKPTKKEKPPRKTFTPPTVEEVAAYCKERNNKIDPEAFVAFYTSKGWSVGNHQMKDWKAAVITWEKRHTKETTTYAPPPQNQPYLGKLNFVQRNDHNTQKLLAECAALGL